MEHCSGGLVWLARYSEVRKNRFSGTGSSPARVQLLRSSTRQPRGCEFRRCSSPPHALNASVPGACAEMSLATISAMRVQLLSVVLQMSRLREYRQDGHCP